MYPIALKLHLAFVILSLVIFVIRLVLSLTGSKAAESRLALIATLGSMLMVVLTAGTLAVTTGQFPFADGWLTEKLFALIGYIALAIAALKTKAKAMQLVLAVGAIGAFGMAMAVAHRHAGLFL